MAVLGVGALAAVQGLPVGAERRDLEGRAAGCRFRPGPGRGRLGLVALEAGPQPGL